jgi:hypothetical protein
MDAVAYRRWNAGRPATASVSAATSADELRAERGPYQIITPAQAAGYLRQGVPLALQPLLGGLAPDVAWRYLETAAAAGVAG